MRGRRLLKQSEEGNIERQKGVMLLLHPALSFCLKTTEQERWEEEVRDASRDPVKGWQRCPVSTWMVPIHHQRQSV